MTLSRSTTLILAASSLVSLICLVLLWAALTDLWHLYGPPDVWTGAALGKPEWRFAAISVWILIASHLAWVGVTLASLLRIRRPGP